MCIYLHTLVIFALQKPLSNLHTATGSSYPIFNRKAAKIEVEEDTGALKDAAGGAEG